MKVHFRFISFHFGFICVCNGPIAVPNATRIDVLLFLTLLCFVYILYFGRVEATVAMTLPFIIHSII
jgi:hypothetical protein